MVSQSSSLLPLYDFSDASSLPLEKRIQQCLDAIKRLHAHNGYAALCELPPLPERGASADELAALEQELTLTLPEDYRYLLSVCRYIDLAPGKRIYGLSYDGAYVSGPMWVLDDVAMPGRYLVIGDHWRFADGDMLLLALDVPEQLVMAYFHEHGPRLEPFAPSVSLALWRLVHEASPQ